MKKLNLYMEVVRWVFGRLPIAFSIPFTILVFWWVGIGYDQVLNLSVISNLAILKGIEVDILKIVILGHFTKALVYVLVFIAGVLIAYNISVLMNKFWYEVLRKPYFFLLDKIVPDTVANAKWITKLAPDYQMHWYIKKLKELPEEDLSPEYSVLEKDDRSPSIGIILAGGGAKGAYQAGAMRAIYEFLRDNKLLSQVEMIAGTSIGSWNSLFWLSGLVKPLEAFNGKSFQEVWWETISIKSVLMPNFYIPFTTKSLISTKPWEEQFDEVFSSSDVLKKNIKESPIKFYLTKSNLGNGNLEFTTNNLGDPYRGIKDEKVGLISKQHNWFYDEKDSFIPTNKFEFVNSESNDKKFFVKLRNGLFASMALPPILPIKNIQTKLFEDGGVVDNLPVYFGSAVHACNLLFVVALNADFEISDESAEAISKSVLSRALRVMTVRQGVLERKALRDVKIYNEISKAVKELDSLEADRWKSDQKSETEDDTGISSYYADSYDFYGLRSKATSVIAVCPDKDLSINTVEFWKTEQAQEAFKIMNMGVSPIIYRLLPSYVETKPFSFSYDEEADTYEVPKYDETGEMVEGETEQMYAEDMEIENKRLYWNLLWEKIDKISDRIVLYKIDSNAEYETEDITRSPI